MLAPRIVARRMVPRATGSKYSRAYGDRKLRRRTNRRPSSELQSTDCAAGRAGRRGAIDLVRHEAPGRRLADGPRTRWPRRRGRPPRSAYPIRAFARVQAGAEDMKISAVRLPATRRWMDHVFPASGVRRRCGVGIGRDPRVAGAGRRTPGVRDAAGCLPKVPQSGGFGRHSARRPARVTSRRCRAPVRSRPGGKPEMLHPACEAETGQIVR
jgi:hypothetical protein